jgi:pimeloyl-ACP methyl ester carboxylesterase
MLVLHGIYGAGRNWASVARRFVSDRPDWGAVLVDLREHGRSQGFPAPHSVDACARDLLRLVQDRGIEARAVLGHSFGGKVALRYVELAADEPAAPHVECVWVIDSTPSPRPPGGSAWAMLGVLDRHPGPFGERDDAIAAVQAEGYEIGVAQWMSTNLVRNPDGRLVWRLDPASMRALLDSFFVLDVWGVIEHPPAGTAIHLVRAAESSIVDESVRDRFEAAGLATGAAHLHELEGGHWLNADNPDGLAALLREHTP